jgi:undecaprenyl pyrophosphate phosphatase UppP
VSYHLTYLQAVVTGLIQGVTELFPVSSLGHNVLLPALIGGSWAKTLNVSATGSPYLAFIVGLHVATAIAMIAFFWRDWLRIVKGFFSSIVQRRIATPDERLAWMIILGTVPVGIVGVVLLKEITKVLAKPELAAVFLAINGVILLVSERMRQRKADAAGSAGGAGGVHDARGASGVGGPRPAFDGPTGGPGFGPADRPQQGYQQQPWQQQWQGPDSRHGGDDRRQPQNGNGQYGGRHSGGGGQGGQYGRDQFGRDQYGRDQYGQGQDQYGQDQYGRDPWGGQPQQPSGGSGDERRPDYGQVPGAGQPAQGVDPWDQRGGDPRGRDQRDQRDPRDPRGNWDQREPRDQRDPLGARQQQAGGRPGDATGAPRAAGAAGDSEADPAVAADGRLSTMTLGRAITIGAAQILALLPGISRDGIVTVAGMERGLRRDDAVRYSFLLSAPVILAAGALKISDLTGPASKGMHGPIIVGSLIAGIGAYVSIRFLTKYFSEDKSLNPFGYYCIIAGLGSLAYLVLK